MDAGGQSTTVDCQFFSYGKQCVYILITNSEPRSISYGHIEYAKLTSVRPDTLKNVGNVKLNVAATGTNHDMMYPAQR